MVLHTARVARPCATRHADRKIRVLIVDDSALTRQLLGKILCTDPGIEVVGAAPDPFVARDKIKLLRPDVLTLDIEMPKMNGITFLHNLMRLHPMPVVMISSYSVKGADLTLQCLELGAVDFVTKPNADLDTSLNHYADEIISKVKAAAGAKIQAIRANRMMFSSVEDKLSATVILSKPMLNLPASSHQPIIAIGASTGGTEALKDILIELPAQGPAVLVTQHIPALFCASLIKRLNHLSTVTVCEASDGLRVVAGHAYVAPGDRHLMLQREGTGYICVLNNGKAVNRFKPSVDVLFRSVAQTAGSNAIGVILTGMGDDGARGMFEMHEAGAYTIAQDENTSVIWGMPGAAVKRGGVDNILPLREIPAVLSDWAQSQR